jgi:hypothetical protein
VTGDAFAELEAVREGVLAEAERFVEELEPILGASLRSGFERLTIGQADHASRMDDRTRIALEAAVGRATEIGVAAVLERLRPPEIWLAPLTAPDLHVRDGPGWPAWLPAWAARMLGGGRNERTSLGNLDDPSNRIWIAISSAPKPLDPVLEEFGFRPGRRRIGGGSFGIAARTLPQLDPSGALGQRWRRYRAAFERLSALAAADG